MIEDRLRSECEPSRDELVLTPSRLKLDGDSRKRIWSGVAPELGRR